MSRSTILCMLALALPLACRPALAGEFDLSDDYGGVGLLQTPTARMAPDGEFGLGISVVHPYNQLHFTLQFLPWLETTFRYTDVVNRYYGPVSLSGTQHDKDKSADFKVRLMREHGWWPALAMGVQDIGGTGLFSSEYFVADHSYGDFDFSLGLGWGRLGSVGDIPNPFGIFSSHFRQSRAQADGSSNSTVGNTGVTRLFTGRSVGLFGGLRWRTPLDGLYLDLEYDGIDYRYDALNENLPRSFPLNVGLTYRWHGIELGTGYERGNTVMVRLMFRTNFQQIVGPGKIFDPPPSPVVVRPGPQPAQHASPPEDDRTPRASKPPTNPETSSGSEVQKPSAVLAARRRKAADDRAAIELQKALELQDFVMQGVTIGHADRTVTVWYSQDKYRDPDKAMGRVARILTELMPADIDTFVLVQVDHGLEDFRITLARKDLERLTDPRLPADQRQLPAVVAGPSGSIGDAEYLGSVRYPQFSYDMSPQLRQSIDGPNSFYLYQLWWRMSGNLQITPHFNLTSTIGINIYNNFDKLTYPSNSVLPHVRSDIAKYLKEGPNNLVNLYGNYVWSPLPSFYTRVSAGIFEEMYAGVAGEALYRPFGQRWAIGIDVNHVYQRNYNQRFSFLDYSVTTGFLEVYYEVPYANLLVSVAAGRYLARDYGGTIAIARRFDSGIVAGAFVTKTNVSAAQFGEGSFDKGIFISIPLDLGFPASTRREATVVFRPLTRDGGQRAFDGPSLYSLTGASDLREIAEGWDQALK